MSIGNFTHTFASWPIEIDPFVFDLYLHGHTARRCAVEVMTHYAQSPVPHWLEATPKEAETLVLHDVQDQYRLLDYLVPYLQAPAAFVSRQYFPVSQLDRFEMVRRYYWMDEVVARSIIGSKLSKADCDSLALALHSEFGYSEESVLRLCENIKRLFKSVEQKIRSRAKDKQRAAMVAKQQQQQQGGVGTTTADGSNVATGGSSSSPSTEQRTGSKSVFELAKQASSTIMEAAASAVGAKSTSGQSSASNSPKKPEPWKSGQGSGSSRKGTSLTLKEALESTLGFADDVTARYCILLFAYEHQLACSAVAQLTLEEISGLCHLLASTLCDESQLFVQENIGSYLQRVKSVFTDSRISSELHTLLFGQAPTKRWQLPLAVASPGGVLPNTGSRANLASSAPPQSSTVPTPTAPNPSFAGGLAGPTTSAKSSDTPTAVAPAGLPPTGSGGSLGSSPNVPFPPAPLPTSGCTTASSSVSSGQFPPAPIAVTSSSTSGGGGGGTSMQYSRKLQIEFVSLLKALAKVLVSFGSTQDIAELLDHVKDRIIGPFGLQLLSVNDLPPGCGETPRQRGLKELSNLLMQASVYFPQLHLVTKGDHEALDTFLPDVLLLIRFQVQLTLLKLGDHSSFPTAHGVPSGSVTPNAATTGSAGVGGGTQGTCSQTGGGGAGGGGSSNGTSARSSAMGTPTPPRLWGRAAVHSPPTGGGSGSPSSPIG